MTVMTAIGTKLYRDKDGLVLIVPPGVDFETDLEEIHHAKSVDIHLRIDAIVSADIDMAVNLPGVFNVVPKYCLTDFHPKKLFIPIKKIEYEDGTVWEPEGKGVSDGSKSNSGRS